MSWFKLLEVEPTKGKITKVSPDGKKFTIQTSPGQKIELDTDKDTGIDVSSSMGQTSINLNKKKGPNVGKELKPGQQVKVHEDKDFRLQAQRDTMNLSDQAVVDLVATLYKKLDKLYQAYDKQKSVLDKLGHREETDAEYFDDLYKRYPNENVNEKGDTANAKRADAARGMWASSKEIQKRFKTWQDFMNSKDFDDWLDDKFRDALEEGDGNMEGYLNTIDEYVEMLFKSEEIKGIDKNEIAYRIQNAVDDIRTRELGLKPSLVRAKYNKQIESVKKKDL